MINKESNLSLNQASFIGFFEFVLSNEELALLQLISSKSDHLLPFWEKVWLNINDYEELSFSCKELMPFAVKKLQDSTIEKNWKAITKGNSDFLSGIPRYTWTKNQYVINQYKILAESLIKEKIDFIALKGVCEMLACGSLSMMRTSRDIDILIKPSDWTRCLKLFENTGWKLAPLQKTGDFFANPAHPHAITLYNNDRIIDLDVHFAAISGPNSYSRLFTEDLWERKVQSEHNSNFYIPSKEDRLIIAAANAFSLHNWGQGQTCKYLFDILLMMDSLNQTEIEKAIHRAEKSLNMGYKMTQLVSLANTINSNEESELIKNKKYILRYSMSNSVVHYMVYLTYLMDSIRSSPSLIQSIINILLLLFKLFRKVFIRIPMRLIRSIFRKQILNQNTHYINKQFYWCLHDWGYNMNMIIKK